MHLKVEDSERIVGTKRRKISFSTSAAMESENPEAHLEPVVMKRKRTSGHSFNGKIKNEIVPAKDKGAAESGIDRLRNKIGKKCSKRMAKLFEKQGMIRQEFDRFWEKKRSDMETDHKLEMSIIHSIYGEGTKRADNKLKLLDDSFEKKMKEHNLQKDVELKNLKAEHLAARNEERQKRARWLAACSSGEPTADQGPESIPLPSEEVGFDAINSLSTDPAEVLETVPTEIEDCANPVELSNMSSDKGIDNGDAIGLPDALMNEADENDEAVGLPSAEQILVPSEQTKASWTPHPCTSLLSQASEDQIPCSSTPDVIQDIGARVVEEQNTSPIEVALSVHVDSLTVAQPNIELHEQDAPDISQGEGANLDAIKVAHEESSEKVQGQDVTDLEDQATPCVEVDVFPSCNEPPSIDVENQSPNLERISPQSAEIADSVVVSHESAFQLGENWDLSSNHFRIGSGSQVDLERISSQSAEITDTVLLSHESASQLGENQDLQSNHFGIVSGSQVNLERISSQTAEFTDTVLHSHESTSQLGVNQELQSNHFGIGSESQVIHETSIQVSTSFQNNVNVTQIVANTVELPHQAGLQPGSVGNLYGSGNQFSSHQVTSLSSPPLYCVPLQHVLEKNSKEIEQLQKSHKDLELQLKSDREKEIREFLAQINSKYNLKYQEAEAEYSYKMNGLEKNRSKILMNKLLAECFSATSVDLFRLRGIQQAAPSSSSTIQHQTLQQMMKPPPQMTMGHQPVSGHPITIANIQAIQQQLLQSNPTRHTPITAPPVQTAQHAPAFSFSSTSTSQPLRPLVINAITPTTNPRVGGNVRSGAPHLQHHSASFTPTPITTPNIQAIQQLQLSNTTRYSPITATPVQTAQHAPKFSLGSTSQPLRPLFVDAITPTPNPSFGGGVRSVAQHLTSSFMPTQTFQLRPSQPLQSPPPPPPMQPSTFQNMPQLQGQPPGFLNMDDRANISSNCASSQINSGFGSLEQSHLARLRNVQGNLTSSAAVNSICISDDD